MTYPVISPEAGEAMRKRKALLALERAEKGLKSSKKSPAAEFRERQAAANAKKETGDMYKPGGKKLHPVAEHIKALYDIDPDSVNEEQKKQYKKITGEDLK